MRLRPEVKCPLCSGTIDGLDIRARRAIPCRSCGAFLHPAPWYKNLISLLALATSFGLLWALSARGFRLALGAVLLWSPAFLFWLLIFGQIVPLQLEECAPRRSEVKRRRRGLFL